jgi:hypothetical protein
MIVSLTQPHQQITDSKNNIIPTHSNLGSYYLYTNGIKETYGNTAALTMIRKKLFEKIRKR